MTHTTFFELPATVLASSHSFFAKIFPQLLKEWSTICMGAVTILVICYIVKKRRGVVSKDNEHQLIKDNTKLVTVRGKRFRVVYVEHGLTQKVPLVVYLHGVGSQIGVWQHQLRKSAANANVLAIDLLGHGKSEVSSKWKDYETESLCKDVIAIMDLFPSTFVIMIAHSYGCVLSTLIYPKLSQRIHAMVFIAPPVPQTTAQLSGAHKLASIPDFALDIMRFIDRRGGIYSKSVNRCLGKHADDALREKQLSWNKESRTSVFKRVIYGMTFPKPSDYSKVTCPVLLIGGAEDRIAPSQVNLRGINGALRPGASLNPDPFIIPDVGHVPMCEQPAHCNAIIGKFLVDRFESLNPEWQILQVAENDPNEKWSLKNYEKWCRTDPVSRTVVGPTPIRAMKIMRQVDDVHSPLAFLKAYPEVGTVIDLSKDDPPYQTYDLSECGVEYIKIAAKSKRPPPRLDVKKFIDAVETAVRQKPTKQVAVHCHYGFNRTGFMICCYMIESCQTSISAAIRHFADARPKGIRHLHFKDELYLRYAPQMRLNGQLSTSDDNQ